MARFGATIFQILAPLQLALAPFFAPLLTAGAVAHEKDRRTLILLLMTNLSNGELVLGKLFASLLQVLVVLGAAAPLFFLIALFGGISWGQIGWVYAVTAAAVVASGSLGSTLAVVREDVSDSGAGVSGADVLVGVRRDRGLGRRRPTLAGRRSGGLGRAISPWRAVLIAARPDLGHGGGDSLGRVALVSVSHRGGDS